MGKTSLATRKALSTLLSLLIASPALAANLGQAAKVSVVPGGQTGAAGIAAGSSLSAGSNLAPLNLPAGLSVLHTPGVSVSPVPQTPSVQVQAAGIIPTVQVQAAVVSGEQISGRQVAAVAGMPSNKSASALPSALSSRETRGDEGATSISQMIAKPESVSAAAPQVGSMSAGDAQSAGAGWFDTILGAKSSIASDSVLSAADFSKSPAGKLLPSLQQAGAQMGWLSGKNETAKDEGVDPDSNDALRAAGTDERLLPIIEILKMRAAADPAELGHLSWALKELIKAGGVVRYAYTFDTQSNAPLPGLFNSADKTLYVNDMLKRADPALQGAVLAEYLQQAYDHLVGRAADTREAQVRKLRVREIFLSGVDMPVMARGVDIGNAMAVELFEQTLQTRLYAVSGASTWERLYGGMVSVNQLSERDAADVKLLRKELDDLKDQLSLFEAGLKRDAANVGYARQVRVLKEKLAIKKGKIRIAESRAKLFGKETAGLSEDSILTSLSADFSHRAKLSDKDLAVVKVKKKPAIQPEIESILKLVRETITKSADPEIRNLGYIVKTIDKLVEAGGHILYAPPGDGAAAYFSPVTLDLVIGREFAKTHPALIAALMVHELTHAADYFGVPQAGKDWIQRPLTRETERNAFTNEAIFIGAFDAEQVSGGLDVRNPMEQKIYDLVFHARLKWVEGKTSLQAMISDAYRELFGAHFSGLQTAGQVKQEIQLSKLSKILEQYEDLKQRRDLTAQAAAEGDFSREGPLKNMDAALSLYEAYRIVYSRQIAQMELEERQAAPEVELELPASVAASAAAPGLRPVSDWRKPRG